MSTDEYITSKSFILFIDQRLRENACGAVEHFLKSYEAVDKSQLYSIPSAIRTGGIKGLQYLTDSQKQKNSKRKNKEFWSFISDLLFTIPEPDFSLRGCIKNELERKQLLASEDQADDKQSIKKIRNSNKAIIKHVMGHTLPIYFEHFNCHYFYRTG